MKSVEQQVIELETKVAFQEDTIHQLSNEIAQLNEHLERHRVMLEFMAGKIKEFNSGQQGVEGVEPPPPHY